MKKVKQIECDIHGKRVACEVVENLGYQGGVYAKIVIYDGKEYAVVSSSRNGYYKTQTVLDKIGFSNPRGM